jgi:hypothetical protein
MRIHKFTPGGEKLRSYAEFPLMLSRENVMLGIIDPAPISHVDNMEGYHVEAVRIERSFAQLIFRLDPEVWQTAPDGKTVMLLLTWPSLPQPMRVRLHRQSRQKGEYTAFVSVGLEPLFIGCEPELVSTHSPARSKKRRERLHRRMNRWSADHISRRTYPAFA